MGNKVDIKPELLVRYLSGEASTDEEQEVNAWRNVSSENEQIFQEYRQIWEADHHTLLSHKELTRDWGHIRSRIHFDRHSHSSSGFWPSLARLAAVFLLMLAVSAALYTYWNVPGFGRWSAFHTQDQVDSMRLPDNSMVFLNNHSSLKYLKNFNDGNRKVTLEGEGYFDVKNDPGNPFLVNTPEGVGVKVLGTSFHFKAGGGFNHIELNVTDGTVSLQYDNTSKVVEQGYSAVPRGRRFHIEPTSDVNFLSWKTGELVFSQTSLSTIAEALLDHFDEIKKLELRTSSDVLVTTAFKNQSLSEILRELEMHFDKKFEFDDGVLTISD